MRERWHGSGSPAGTSVKRGIPSFLISVVVLFTVSCAQPQRSVPENSNEPAVSSTPPFQTKEPERYRATRTITTVAASGETTVNKNRIARDGELRRDEQQSEALRAVYLNLRDGVSVVLLQEEKLFVDFSDLSEEIARVEEPENLPERLLHAAPKGTTYQHIGAETIAGRNTQKYRVVVNSSPDPNVSVSETVIWVDDALQMPIKSETKSSNGTRITMELSEIVLDADQSLFRVPEGYKKISIDELGKRLKLDWKE